MELSQSILNSVPIQVAVLDQAGVIRFTNAAWERQPSPPDSMRQMRALAGENYVGALRAVNGRLAADAASIAAGLEAVLNRQQAEFTYEYPMPGERGERWYLVSVTPLSGEGGGAVVTHTDITARKRAERALLDSQERFKRIAESAPVMIYRWTFAEGFEYVSPACVAVSGYQPEDFYADADLGVRQIHADDLPEFNAILYGLRYGGQPSGECVVRFHHRSGHTAYIELRLTPIPGEDGSVLGYDGIANDITGHIVARERLRELTSRVTRAHEDERRRIARELHDEIGQSLTIARMRLTMAENALPEEATSAHEKLAVLNELVGETLQTVRALSHELRPPLLDEVGWQPAINWLCDSISQRTGLPITFQHAGDTRRLAPEIELTAYRIVQEALTNTVKHAGATQATVLTVLDDRNLQLSIADDGAGFDLSPINRAENPGMGLGLLGMEERAVIAGGEMHIETAPGTGTIIRAILPDRKGGEHEADHAAAG